MFNFKLPDLGEGIHEAEILKWHIEEGATVEKDAPMVDLETDKAAVTVPAPVGGRVASLSAKVGDTVTVGQVLVAIDDGSAEEAESAAPGVATAAAPPSAAETAGPTPEQALPRAARGEGERAVSGPEALIQEDLERDDVGPRGERPEARRAPPPSAPAAPPRSRLAPSGAGRRRLPIPAAPATRRLARELGIDLAQIVPTGPAGRVTADDVRGFAERARPGAERGPALAGVAPEVSERRAQAEYAAHAASAIPLLDIEPLPDFSQWGPVEREPLRSIRRRVAHKMVTSMILVPHVAHMDEADVTLLEQFRLRERERRNGRPGGHLTLLAFVMKAVTAGLRAAPAFNASLDPFSEEIVYKKYYNVGFAADTGKGLIVPVVKDTDRQSILQISQRVEELAGRAREGSLDVADLRGGTFTITNVGPLGGTALIPAINYPEVAILGMGRVQEKPVVRGGEIVIRKMLPLTLSFDHRIADGADAARFVTELVRQLSDPNLLLLET